jgi:hypothetical protein
VLPTPTPHHSGTDEDRKGGPLWLRVQDYFVLPTLRQDQLPVLTTAVLVTTRTGFPPQVRRQAGLALPHRWSRSGRGSVGVPGQGAAEAPHPAGAIEGVGVGDLLGMSGATSRHAGTAARPLLWLSSRQDHR